MNRSDAERLATQLVEAWNAGDADRLASFYAGDAVASVNADAPLEGREAIAGWARGYMDAFSDLHLGLERVSVDGDRFFTEIALSGTHDGPLGGTAPTYRRSTNRSLAVYEVDDDGCVRTSSLIFDTGKLMADLELLPA